MVMGWVYLMGLFLSQCKKCDRSFFAVQLGFTCIEQFAHQLGQVRSKVQGWTKWGVGMVGTQIA